MKAEVWLLSWDFQPRWSAPANKGFCRPKSGCTLCSDFFQYWLGLGLGLIMRICEDYDRAVPTPWYFHFVITRCSLLLPSIWSWTGKHQALFWAVPTQRAELLGGATMEPINQVVLQQDQYFLVMSADLLALAERSYITQKFWRVEVRSGTHKTNEEQRGGKQARKHLCFNPILIVTRVPFAGYMIPRASSIDSYLSRPFG